ncbi:MFS general substrate transporter [Martensiomyces pterosporus]|nr:MFS general substrate transporter [Martensiomyces pterosporus]
MASANLGADDYGGSSLTRFICKANDFRRTPAAVLMVSTMAVFADTVVYGLIVPFLPEILQDKLGMSSSANGILFGCFGVGVLVGAPVSAYISDRWHIRKWPMIIGLLGLGATSVLFALANAFWELVVARLAQGVSSGITWAIGLGMIADVYAGEAIGKAMGVAFSGFTLGYLGGPVIGGAIYGAGGTHAIAIFVAAITVVDLVFRLLLKEPKEAAATSSVSIASMADEKTTVAKGGIEVQAAEAIAQPDGVYMAGGSSIRASSSAVASGSAEKASVEEISMAPAATNTSNTAAPRVRRTTMWDLLKEWPILACCVATITVTGASGSFEPTLPIHLFEEYNLKPAMIGVVFIAVVVPNVIIGPIAGKFTDDARVLSKLAPYGRFGFMIIGSILSAIAIGCLGATKSLAGLIVNLVVIGFLAGFAAVPIMSTMGVHVHRMGGDAYAKVYALFNIAYSIGVIVIPTVLPPVMNSIGFAGTMGVVSAILVLGAVILAISPTYMLCKYGRAAFVGENAREFI